MNDKDFVNLVNRELRRNATEEERAYLWSMPDIVMRWRAELIAIKSLCSLETQKVKANLEGAHDLYLKARPDGEGKINEEARAEWHAFRDEQNRKKTNIHWIQTNVDIRLARINAWSRSQAERAHEGKREYRAFEELRQELFNLNELRYKADLTERRRAMLTDLKPELGETERELVHLMNVSNPDHITWDDVNLEVAALEEQIVRETGFGVTWWARVIDGVEIAGSYVLIPKNEGWLEAKRSEAPQE